MHSQIFYHDPTKRARFATRASQIDYGLIVTLISCASRFFQMISRQVQQYENANFVISSLFRNKITAEQLCIVCTRELVRY